MEWALRAESISITKTSERNTSNCRNSKQAAMASAVPKGNTLIRKGLLCLISAQATSSFLLHLSLPRGFVWRVYFWLHYPSQSTWEAINAWKQPPSQCAICSSPWSHSLTRSSLHDVIGSMLGVLLQSLVQLPAFLADFYLSGLLEEEKADPELESDDDEWHSFAQVQQVRESPSW